MTILKKISEKIVENENKKKEEERIEKERVKQEKQKLLEHNEKELLVELILYIKNIEKEQKVLLEKMEDLNSTVWLSNNKN